MRPKSRRKTTEEGEGRREWNREWERNVSDKVREHQLNGHPTAPAISRAHPATAVKQVTNDPEPTRSPFLMRMLSTNEVVGELNPMFEFTQE